MTELVHQLFGYDRKTEKLVYQRDIPPDQWCSIRKFLRADDGDPSMVDIYRIDEATLSSIAEIIRNANEKDLDYFIECSTQD